MNILVIKEDFVQELEVLKQGTISDNLPKVLEVKDTQYLKELYDKVECGRFLGSHKA